MKDALHGQDVLLPVVVDAPRLLEAARTLVQICGSPPGLNRFTRLLNSPNLTALCGSSRRPRRRALLIACCYQDAPKEFDTLKLSFSWKDVDTMKDLLLRSGWKEDEIVVLDDRPDKCACIGVCQHKRAIPTKHNIIKELKKLVRGARSGDLLVLHMSGHGHQQKAFTDAFEKDGKDEFFIPCDFWKHMTKKNRRVWQDKGKLVLCYKSRVMDNTLRRLVVDPLPTGVSLKGIFDCCNSGTFLDLPNEPERFASTRYAVAEIKNAMATTLKCFPSRRTTMPLPEPQSNSVDDKDIIPFPCAPPSTKFHSKGRCCRRACSLPYRRTISTPALLPKFLNKDKRVIRADVISISSCRDGSLSFESEDGGCLVTKLPRILGNASEQRISIGTLHDKLKEELKAEFEDVKHRTIANNGNWDNSLQAPVPQVCFSGEDNWNDEFSLRLMA